MSAPLADIGSGGRLYSVEEEKPAKNRNRLSSWAEATASMVVNAPKRVKSRLNWREIVSTLGELASISLISVGAGWYSLGAGFISGGVLLLAFSVATGVTGPIFPQGKPEKR